MYSDHHILYSMALDNPNFYVLDFCPAITFLFDSIFGYSRSAHLTLVSVYFLCLRGSLITCRFKKHCRELSVQMQEIEDLEIQINSVIMINPLS